MNWFKTFVLMGILTGIAILIGGLIGGRSGMIIAFGIAAVMNFGSYWFSDKIVLSMYGAREVSEAEDARLFAIVRRLAQSAGLPMPKVYRMPADQPNAFATGRNPSHAAVAVTDGLMALLNDDEVEGVLAHELAHVKHRDILIGTIAATMAGAIMMISNMARFAAIFGGGRDNEEGGNPIAVLIVSIVAGIAAMMVQMAISRSREFGADEGGAEISGKPWALANALRKLEHGAQKVPMDANPATAHMFIVNPFSAEGVARLFSTHPPTSDRIARLERM
ncbi:MAG: zinc metalloprotease HtpX [Armatimonadetes bacterium]|nr:zinc metalloprotease HtpX [Armatimonadota bacterium]